MAHARKFRSSSGWRPRKRSHPRPRTTVRIGNQGSPRRRRWATVPVLMVLKSRTGKDVGFQPTPPSVSEQSAVQNISTADFRRPVGARGPGRQRPGMETGVDLRFPAEAFQVFGVQRSWFKVRHPVPQPGFPTASTLPGPCAEAWRHCVQRSGPTPPGLRRVRSTPPGAGAASDRGSGW